VTRAIGGLLSFLVLAGCSAGTGGGSPSSSPTLIPATPTASATAFSAAPTREASTPTGFEIGPLAAGAYAVGTDPVIGFTLDDGWSTDSTDPDAFDVLKAPAYVAMAHLGQVFIHDTETADAGLDPASAAELMRSNPALTLTDAKPITIGGADGAWFEVSVAGDAPVLGFRTSGGRTYRFTPDVRVRGHILSVSGALVVITVEAPPDRMDEAVTLAKPVIDSVTFG